MKQTKKAFTLVELAIVLVVIGILLGAVLKSRGIIENSKTKKLLEEVQNLQTAVALYYDNYNYLPGDDPNAIDRLGASYNGNGDRNIAGFTSNCTSANSESCAAWEDLRLAGFIKGEGVKNPKTPFNTPFGIGYSYGHYNVIGVYNIPKRIAAAIDSKLDDGNLSSGKILWGKYTNDTSNLLLIETDFSH